MLEFLEPRSLLAGDPGVIVFQTDRDGNHELYSMNPDGTGLKNLTNNPATDAIPQVSFDGTKVAFASDRAHPGNMDIWVMDIDGTNLVNITHNGLPGASNWDPALSPDNSKVLYMAPGVGGGYDIWVSDANGTNPVNLTNSPLSDSFASWSDDGEKIVFGSYRHSTPTVANEEIYWMNKDGTQQTRVTNHPARDTYPVFDHGATEIVFTTDRDGNREIYECELDGTGLVNLTNNPGVDQVPYYSPDFERISFISYRDGNGEIYVMNDDGSQQTRITDDPAQDVYPGWGRTPDLLPPTVLAMVFDFDASPPELRVHFSEDVSQTLGEDDLVLKNLTTGDTVPPAAMMLTYDSTSNAGHFSFPGIPSAILADGNYLATFPAGAFEDAAGHALAADASDDFFLLTADANHDRYVNTFDFNPLAMNFSKISGVNFGGGDFNYDGSVNALDFNALAARFGTYLEPPLSSAPASAKLAVLPSGARSLFSAQSIRDGEQVDGILLPGVPEVL